MADRCDGVGSLPWFSEGGDAVEGKPVDERDQFGIRPTPHIWLAFERRRDGSHRCGDRDSLLGSRRRNYVCETPPSSQFSTMVDVAETPATIIIAATLDGWCRDAFETAGSKCWILDIFAARTNAGSIRSLWCRVRHYHADLLRRNHCLGRDAAGGC